MTEIFQPKGSDGDYAYPVVDGNGLPFNLSGYANIAVFLQYKNSEDKLISYDTTALTLEVIDAANGILGVKVKRDEIADWKTNTKIYASVKFYETNANFADNIFKFESVPNYFITITKTGGNND